jgi:2-polyprenyl-3-methyl-5-hydroxy-6-metoxy-1,4-benzoquinol methylase
VVTEQGSAHQSYDPAYFKDLFEIEDRHFWFRARNRMVSILAKQMLPDTAQRYKILEIGCGTGNVLRVLDQACPGGMVIGADLFAQGLQYAKQRTSCPLVQGDMHHLPFNAQFDLIGLFDVLEHLPDDETILKNLQSMLRPGGRLFLTVPAHPSLWSYFDTASHHCRRYKPTELKARLHCAGFRVEYLTQYMASLFPAVWLGRRVARLMGQRSTVSADSTHDLALRELRIRPVFNGVLAFLLDQETRAIARRMRLPIGTSVLAIAYKEPL